MTLLFRVAGSVPQLYSAANQAAEFESGPAGPVGATAICCGLPGGPCGADECKGRLGLKLALKSLRRFTRC